MGLSVIWFWVVDFKPANAGFFVLGGPTCGVGMWRGTIGARSDGPAWYFWRKGVKNGGKNKISFEYYYPKWYDVLSDHQGYQ